MNLTHHRPEQIVVGVDGSLESHAALRWAIDHARPGDTVTLCHAFQPSPVAVSVGLADPDDDTAAREFVHHELARIDALPRDADVTIRCDVLHGDPRDCLSAVDADLLVVGAGGHGRLAGALLGSVSAHVTRHAHIPVVVVPHPCHLHPEVTS